jgi:predicted glycoside hydrolase/deacetylase ChbG (UPF0249 family)
MDTARILIVNADDFGLSPGVNAGILEAHNLGIVTSTSLMVRPPAAPQAARLARDYPKLAVGLHVDLCEWVFQNGEWRLLYEVAPMADAAAVEMEIARQLETFETLTGHPPTHLDAHQHVHRNEPVRSILLRAARSRGIALRANTPGLRYCGAFYGQSNKGEPYPAGIAAETLLELVCSLSEGVTELGCHPARTADIQSVYLHERLVELKSLCDPRVKEALERESIQLCSFLDPEVQGLVRRTR